MIPLAYYLALSAVLFALGLWGALARSNAIRVLMGIEIMLNAASLNFIAFNRHLLATGQAADATSLAGQVFAVFVITIAAAEAAIGLAIILLIARRRGIVDVNQVSSMRG